ncbi:hypothetical protein BD626DRAFT_496134 [Schizophyllum amplum]|uniref:Uncharacterized protein n=1 Tax=Schizophyllum amplum TaxID=97359 RepID=A0A550CEP4_9AGAR|nr:hypothetical protein BD626DRAFT_496134 [Auriculariopsis ampla]
MTTRISDRLLANIGLLHVSSCSAFLTGEFHLGTERRTDEHTLRTNWPYMVGSYTSRLSWSSTVSSLRAMTYTTSERCFFSAPQTLSLTLYSSAFTHYIPACIGI